MINKNKLIFSIAIIIFAVLSRILLRDIPNIETITITALLAGSILGGAYAVVIPLSAIALTDIWIGNNSIMLFTWSAWALIGLIGLIAKKDRKDSFKYAFKLTGLGMGASLLFYLWTNFGVWLMWPQMYPTTLSGLGQCYIMGLPFLRYSLISNLIFIPSVSFCLVACFKWLKVRNKLPELVKSKRDI
ncbi:MAG: DUF6580 family putative transport protein [Patescibacteria group bacterium]